MGTKVRAVSVSPEVLYCHYPSPTPTPHHPAHVLLSLAIGGLVLLQVLPLLMRAAFHYTTTNAAAPIYTVLPPILCCPYTILLLYILCCSHTAPIYIALPPHCPPTVLPPYYTALHFGPPTPFVRAAEGIKCEDLCGYFSAPSPYNIASSLSISIKIVLPDYMTSTVVASGKKVQLVKYTKLRKVVVGK